MQTFKNLIKDATSGSGRTTNHMKKYIVSVIVLIGILIGIPYVRASIYPVQAQSFTLAGSGSAIGDSTITLSSFKDIDGNNLTMSDFGTIGFGTLEPGSGSQEESITFTGISQNSNGSATLTGINSVAFYTPFTLTGNLTKSHPGASTFVLSNTSYFYARQFPVLDNNSTITGYWNFPTPVIGTNPTTKDYVDGKVFAGIGNASETATGTVQIATNLQAASSTTNGTLGRLALPASIATSTYNSSGSLQVVVTQNDNKIDPNFLKGIITAAQDNVFTGSNTFATTTAVAVSNFASTTIFATSTPGTFTYTKPANLKYLIIEIVGGGGGGGGNTTSGQTSSGGGGGEYCKKIMTAAEVATTTTVTIGARGLPGAGSGGTGGTGGTTSFGTACTAVGGTGGDIISQPSGHGGTGGTGNNSIHIKGGPGGNTATANGVSGGDGGNSFFGAGADEVTSDGSDRPGSDGGDYGGGGGGAHSGGGGDNAGGTGGSGAIIMTQVFF